ncbi:microtubule-associated protein 70-4-like protein [Tanacetum coccineum]
MRLDATEEIAEVGGKEPQSQPSPSLIMCIVAYGLAEIAKLQDDNTALDRFTKSKEAALLEAQRTIQVVSTKASMVNDLQNKNQERCAALDAGGLPGLLLTLTGLERRTNFIMK